MGIYRGPGGTGDAVNDASSEALLTVQAKDAALVAQAAAEAAATNAQTAETNAETAETNAETAATNASNSATSASTSATNAAASASTATTKASEASTSATNAASSASSASTSASSASTSASTATTQATNAYNSASAASTSATNASNSASAASTSATNAASSATSAAGSATTATTQASSASTSATNAASSATSASGSATTATTQAGIATTKASEAATSATNAASSASAASTSATNASNSASSASTSATNASNSATSAATSATNAAASYDSFDDRYLGPKATAPSVDNDGNTLLTGALYFDTVSNSMKVWSGSAWLDAYASLSGALIATNNLSDLNNTATARTNLGLGTIATQAASSVAITGGAIDGTAVGATTASTGRFTSLSDSGNLTFTGTANRITGDFSNATVANRVFFQNSAAATTWLGVIPGTGSTQSQVAVYNNADPTNSAYLRSLITSAETRIDSNITGTGTYLPLTMFTGGSERLRIDTSGNLGIGTSSPAAKLHVSGENVIIDRNAGDPYLSFYTSGSATNVNLYGGSSTGFRVFTGGSERMRITSAGNVGIGTSSPSSLLNVSGLGSTGLLTVNRTDGSGFININSANNTSGVQLSSTGAQGLQIYTNVATSSVLAMSIDADGKVGIGISSLTNQFSVVKSSNTGGAASFPSMLLSNTLATQGDGSTTYNFARFDIKSGNGTVFGDVGTRYDTGYSGMYLGTESNHPLYFQTAGTERMRVDSSGNVGIGTSSPATILDITKSTDTKVRIKTTGGATTAGIDIAGANATVDTNNVILYQGGNSEGYLWNRANTYFSFGTNNTERMRITSAGNVGIGLTNPTQKLEVTGTIKINGGVVAGERGTAAAPAFSFSDNLNSGMFNISNLDLGFATQGVERMRITSAGGVSFGATGTAYGTSGQVLTSAGNAPPTWGAVAGVGVAKAYGFINNQSGSAVTYNTLGVSSVTQTNTGRNTINWTTAFPNANYIIVATTNKGDGNYDMNSIVNTGTTTGVNQTTTQAFLANGYSNQFQNSCQVCFVVFYPS